MQSISGLPGTEYLICNRTLSALTTVTNVSFGLRYRLLSHLRRHAFALWESWQPSYHLVDMAKRKASQAILLSLKDLKVGETLFERVISVPLIQRPPVDLSTGYQQRNQT